MTSSLLTKSRRFEDESKRQRIFVIRMSLIVDFLIFLSFYRLFCKTQSTLENIR
ncbi:hypothetical protein HMPREF3216_00100 [Gardnerella vaginalis]|uniref:Uncharacterized protein n=1 Tax=Gardnerella vaginalis TaxID=2702 RepID=A0A133NT19_GARVA|nr:hypothetical protein HMPREF3216_00100 [Gardnerella vaginalis]